MSGDTAFRTNDVIKEYGQLYNFDFYSQSECPRIWFAYNINETGNNTVKNLLIDYWKKNPEDEEGFINVMKKALIDDN